MKKLGVFLIIIALVHLQTPGYAQFEKVIKESFRVNPFEGSFSAFLKTLTTDPELFDKTVELKTDSTRYFVKGSYKKFNPLRIKTNKVDISFAENIMDKKYEGIQMLYTSYTYQIVAYLDDTEGNRILLAKEVERLKKRLDGYFVKSENVSTGQGIIVNYYYSNNYVTINNSVVHPVSLIWQFLPDTKEMALIIQSRLVVVDNYARLAGLF